MPATVNLTPAGMSAGEKNPSTKPATLLRHHFRRFPNSYVEKQFYLYPDALELQLRSGT